MDELLKKIPVSIIAICVAVLTILISFAVFRGIPALMCGGSRLIQRDKPTVSAPEARAASFPVGSVIPSYLAPPG